ncbi:MAG: hypothetical protein QM771_10810 [Nitrospira sp.]
MMHRTRRHDFQGHTILCWTGGLILLLTAAFPTGAQAEKMDLGKIPKEQVKGWCDAHSGQYLDWGGAGSTCMTDTGAGIVCDNKDNCTGYPPKPAKMTSQQFGIAAFPELRMAGKRAPIMRRSVEAEQADSSAEHQAVVETGRIECTSSGTACFCSGNVDCDIMKAKICHPEAQACRTVNGTETCSCQVRE